MKPRLPDTAAGLAKGRSVGDPFRSRDSTLYGLVIRRSQPQKGIGTSANRAVSN